MEGKMNAVNLFEPFQQNNIDRMYVEQSKSARSSILTEFLMPEVMLGKVDSGIFNQQQYQEAFNYVNALTETDRMLVEKAFNKFWENTIFYNQLDRIKIIPLEMKSIQNTQKETENKSNAGAKNE
jgi:hypothetical protein